MIDEEQLVIADHWIDISGYVTPDFTRRLVADYRTSRQDTKKLVTALSSLLGWIDKDAKDDKSWHEDSVALDAILSTCRSVLAEVE